MINKASWTSRPEKEIAYESRIEALERDLARSRDLASLGEAAAALAHEIKNPLAAISAPLQIIRERLAGNDELRDVVQEVISEVQRLDALVRRLLVLSKPWNPKKERADLLEIVRRVFALSQAEPAFARVQLRLQSAAPVSAPVDAALFEQVLWNLIQNAAEAMPEGGEVRVSCEEGLRVVTLRVADNGPGIPPAVQTRLFKPFFTTKPGGSGLGLAISRKIMEAHGGFIRISSEQGRGTEVILGFPKGEAR